MDEKFSALDKCIKSKEMIIFLIIMTVASILFHPILNLKRKSVVELQEGIKARNRGRFENSSEIPFNDIR
ncbi:MAG: hypothetical protein KAW83_02825 [Dehalococcoidia bacterium]|nr:hypothetical protein [Dehalococcoidia bacterium]